MSVSTSATSRTHRPAGRRLLVAAPIAVAALGAVALGMASRVQKDQIAPGVHVASLDLSNKSRAEANAALTAWIQERQKTPVLLRFAPETGIKRVWKTTAEKLGLGLNGQATLDSAGQAGQTSVLGRVTRFVGGAKPVQVGAQVIVDEAKLRTYLSSIARLVRHRARNARFLVSVGSGHTIRPERPGHALDTDASVSAVKTAWNTYNAANASPEPGSEGNGQDAGTEAPKTGSGAPAPTFESKTLTPVKAILALKTTQAAVTKADLVQITGELGSFSTTYATGDRGDNVALAASNINGTLLRPGEVFSYNKVVGPRSLAAGFKAAPEIVGGQLRPGVGGGVCQVSSTLYNAVLLAGLKIVHRDHHAFPVHYLRPGRDATVVYGAIDFLFRNNTDAPIYIEGRGRGGRLRFRVLGKVVPGRSIALVPGQVRFGPAAGVRPARAGEKPSAPHPSISATWFRVVRQDGEEVSREPLHTYYRQITGVAGGAGSTAEGGSIGHRRVRRRTRLTSRPAAAPTPDPTTEAPAPAASDSTSAAPDATGQ